MTKSRILITGASGVLGWHLCRYFSQQGWGEVRGTYRSHKPEMDGVRFDRLPLEEPERIRQYFGENVFETVIHSAAVTSPDDCEKDPEFARRVNEEAVRLLARSLPEHTLLVYISTDLVFDGRKGNYREEDEPNPVNFYGETKLRAEEAARLRPNSVVLRVAKLYSTESPFSSSFESWMRDRFEQGVEIPLFKDQYRTPLFVGDLARALDRLHTSQPRSDLYHLGGPERVSRLEFGLVFSEIGGYDASLIRPTSASELGLVARGQDCSLDSSRFCDGFGFRRSSLEEGFRKMMAGEF